MYSSPHSNNPDIQKYNYYYRGNSSYMKDRNLSDFGKLNTLTCTAEQSLTHSHTLSECSPNTGSRKTQMLGRMSGIHFDWDNPHSLCWALCKVGIHSEYHCYRRKQDNLRCNRYCERRRSQHRQYRSQLIRSRGNIQQYKAQPRRKCWQIHQELCWGTCLQREQSQGYI